MATEFKQNPAKYASLNSGLVYRQPMDTVLNNGDTVPMLEGNKTCESFLLDLANGVGVGGTLALWVSVYEWDPTWCKTRIYHSCLHRMDEFEKMKVTQNKAAGDVKRSILNLGRANLNLLGSMEWGFSSPTAVGINEPGFTPAGPYYGNEFDHRSVHMTFHFEGKVIKVYVNGVCFGILRLEMQEKAWKSYEKLWKPPSCFIRVPPRENAPAVQITGLQVYSRKLSEQEIKQIMMITAPNNADFVWIRAPLIGVPDFQPSGRFRQEFLFGAMPAPYVFPRLFFGPNDLPALRAMYTKSQYGRLALKTAKFEVDRFFSMPQSLKGPDTTTYNDLMAMARSRDVVAMMQIRKHILMDRALDILLVNDQARGKMLAELTYEMFLSYEPVFKEKREKIPPRSERYCFHSNIKGLERVNGFHIMVGRHQLFVLLDLVGFWMTKQQARHCMDLSVMAIEGYQTAATQYYLDTPQFLKRFADTVMDEQHNQTIWDGSLLALNKVFIHGHEGADPKEIVGAYNMMLMHQACCLTRQGSRLESSGKEAQHQAFLLWLAMARLRVPGMDKNLYEHPSNCLFPITTPYFIQTPYRRLTDFGSWSKGEPQAVYDLYLTLLKWNEVEHAWLSRLTKPWPLPAESDMDTIIKWNSASMIDSAKGDVQLMVKDKTSLEAILDEHGKFVGFSLQSSQSAVFTAEPILDIKRPWSFRFSVELSKEKNKENGKPMGWDSADNYGLFSLAVPEMNPEPNALVLATLRFTFVPKRNEKNEPVLLVQPRPGSIHPKELKADKVVIQLSSSPNRTFCLERKGPAELDLFDVDLEWVPSQGLILNKTLFLPADKVKDPRFYLILGGGHSGSRCRFAQAVHSYPFSRFSNPVMYTKSQEADAYVESYKWKFEPETLNRPLPSSGLASFYSLRHWSEIIPPTTRPSDKSIIRNFALDYLDDQKDCYPSLASSSHLATSIFTTARSGGHYFKYSGHFDLYGVGVGWLGVPDSYLGNAEGVNSMTIDGKHDPGRSQGARINAACRLEKTNSGSVCCMDMSKYWKCPEIACTRFSTRIYDESICGISESEIKCDDGYVLHTGVKVAYAYRNFVHMRGVHSKIPDRSMIIISDQIKLADGAAHEYVWRGAYFVEDLAQIRSRWATKL